MSSVNSLDAKLRESFGKGAARKLRAAGVTPAVVYGHGADPLHVALETHPLSLIVRHANAVIELTVAGKKQLVLVKDVQRDPVRQVIEHVDLLIVRKGETVEVEVPVTVVGEPFAGSSALQELNTVLLSVPATSIPEFVEVDVEGATDGTLILAGDIKLPAGATLVDDPEALVVNVMVPRAAAEPEEAEAAVAEGATAAESSAE